MKPFGTLCRQKRDQFFTDGRYILQGEDTLILLQNENGPCPMLAAANVLLLRKAIELPEACVLIKQIRLDQLVTILLESVLDGINTDTENIESQQQINDLVSTLPKLSKGLDLNPKFTAGPTGFEYTVNVAIFDAWRIDLYHGWLADPQNEEAFQFLDGLTYNQLMDKFVEESDVVERMSVMENSLEQSIHDGIVEPVDPSSSKHGMELVTEGASVEESEPNDAVSKLSDLRQKAYIYQTLQKFILESSSQLTYYGLTQLHETLANDSLGVFFRNDHFNTITKRDGKLYLLVTDEGYSNSSEIVWERLDNIDGDCDYVDSAFSTQGVIAQRELQHERELQAQIAVATQRSLNDAVEANNEDSSFQQQINAQLEANKNSEDASLAMAMALQKKYEEDENERVARMIQSEEYTSARTTQSRAVQSRRNASSSSTTPSCVIS